MGLNIFVIDDEVDHRSSLQDRLAMEGYHVQTVQDGRTGLNLQRDHHVDRVITDVPVSEVDGLEVLGSLRRLSSALLIMVIPGGGTRDLDFLVKAQEFGSARTISKHFLLEKIVELVNGLVNSHSYSVD